MNAEVKELKGKVTSSEQEVNGKTVKVYTLKTEDGEFKVIQKLSNRLKRYDGKTVQLKADVNENQEIEKISSVKASKEKGKKDKKKK